MRQLLIVPIIHSTVDMGSMKETLKETFIRKYGKEKWAEHIAAINEIWEEIRKSISSLELACEKVRIYQDGLPVSGNVHQIVQDIARQGSENYKIIVELLEKKAKVEGTEDPRLLLREYDYLKKRSSLDNSAGNYEEPEEKEILAERDLFIAHRIDETLRHGETGILFIGMKHKVDEALSPDIEITYLDLEDRS